MGYVIAKSHLTVGCVLVANIPKGASMSIKEASETNWYVSNHEAEIYPLRLFFIREPFDRFCSAYSFFNGLYWKGQNYNGSGVCEAAAKSYYEFVNFCLENDDEHWNPQVERVHYKGKLSPTHIIKFDDLLKLWPKFSTNTLRQINTSVRLPVCEKYRRPELNKMFGDDIRVYRKALTYDQVSFDG